MLIPSKWYQSGTVSGDLPGSQVKVPVNSEFADMFLQSKLEAKIDAITDRLCQNIKKIFEDAISRIKLGSGVLHEDFEEDEHQNSESASSEWSCGEEEPPSQEDKKEEVLEISRSDRNFYSDVRTLSGDAMVEHSGGGLISPEAWSGGAETNGSGKFLTVLPGGLSGGEDGFATGRFGGRHGSAQGGVAGNRSNEKCNCLKRKSLGGVFERGGAGGSGSGGGPGFYAGETGGVAGCWSSECGPEIMNVVLSCGVRNGDFSGGFTGGGVLDRGGLVSSRTGPLVGGGSDGENMDWLLLGGFQNSLERKEYERRFWVLVGLERKPSAEDTRRGGIVHEIADDVVRNDNSDDDEIADLGDKGANGPCETYEVSTGPTTIRPNFLIATQLTFLPHSNPHLKALASYLLKTDQGQKLGLEIFGYISKSNLSATFFNPHYSTLQLTSTPFQTYFNLTQVFNTNTNYSTQKPIFHHDKLLNFSAMLKLLKETLPLANEQPFSVQFSLAFGLFKGWVSDHCCQGRESSSDYKPP